MYIKMWNTRNNLRKQSQESDGISFCGSKLGEEKTKRWCISIPVTAECWDLLRFVSSLAHTQRFFLKSFQVLPSLFQVKVGKNLMVENAQRNLPFYQIANKEIKSLSTKFMTPIATIQNVPQAHHKTSRMVTLSYRDLHSPP